MVAVAEEDQVNHAGTTSMNGQADGHCHHCYASQMTEVDGQPSQQRRMSEYPKGTGRCSVDNLELSKNSLVRIITGLFPIKQNKVQFLIYFEVSS